MYSCLHANYQDYKQVVYNYCYHFQVLFSHVTGQTLEFPSLELSQLVGDKGLGLTRIVSSGSDRIMNGTTQSRKLEHMMALFDSVILGISSPPFFTFTRIKLCSSALHRLRPSTSHDLLRLPFRLLCVLHAEQVFFFTACSQNLLQLVSVQPGSHVIICLNDHMTF